MFFGSNSNLSQPNINNQINQNTGFNSIANSGYVGPYVSNQQTTPVINTPFAGFDSNDDFGSQLYSQYGTSYLECSMPYNVLDGQSESTSEVLDIMYKPYDRSNDTPDDHVQSNSFEDTTIVNISYKSDLSTDEYRWQFYRNHLKEVNAIQKEITRSSGSNDQSSIRTNTTGLTLSQTQNTHTTSDASSRHGTNTLQTTGFNTTGLGQSNNLFGQPTTNTVFGQPTTNLFGQSTTNTGFGQNSSSLFGQPASNTAFGQSNNTLFAQPSAFTGLAQSNTSLFGQATTNTGFGQPSTIGFGQTNNTAIGQTNTTGFGQSGINTGFGQTNINSGFGQSSINKGFGQNSNNLFGQSTNTTAFGQPATNTGFGQSNFTGTGFSQTSVNTGFGQTGSSLFGQPSTNNTFSQANTNTQVFGQPSTNTAFGQTSSTLLGQPTTNTTLGQSNFNNTGFGQTSTNLFGQTTTTGGFGQPSMNNTGFGQTNVNNTGFVQTGTNTGFGEVSNTLLGQPTINTGLGLSTNFGLSQPGINTGFGLPTTVNTGFGQAGFANTSLGQPSINTGFGQSSINTAFNSSFGQTNTNTGAAMPAVISTGLGQTSIIDNGFLQSSVINNPSFLRSTPEISSVFIQPVNVYDGNVVQAKIKRYKSGAISFVGSLSEIESVERPNTQFGTDGTSNEYVSQIANNGNLGSMNGSRPFTDSAKKPGNSIAQSPDMKSVITTKTLAEEVRAELLIFDRHMMEGKMDREREFKRIMRSFDADRYYYNRTISEKPKNRRIYDTEDGLLGKGNNSESSKHPNLYLLNHPYGLTPKDFIIESFMLRAQKEKAEEERAERERQDDEENNDPIFLYEQMCKSGHGLGECSDVEGDGWDRGTEIRSKILKEAENKRAERRKERNNSYSNTLEEVLEKASNMMNSDENFLEPDSTWNWEDPLSNLKPKYKSDIYDSDDEENKKVIKKPEDRPNPNAPMLKAEGYTTRPSIRVLKAMTDKELSEVKDFQISREGYGDILFPGLTDVRGLDLDDVVDIGYRQVSLYNGRTRAPSEGTGLNKRAFVSMNNCTPTEDERTRFTSEMSHKNMMRKYTQMIGCNYLGINFKIGTWIFETPFFVGTAEGIQRDGTIKYFNTEKNRDLVN
ncbi:hypothetical protein MACJ_003169 [Theileria orientalis]|uniref:Peptidase S59 domain-containing protein n=1 Tax=Theileria orientalis TaxID=68886 RepID=A0A976M7E9_THEOR|nr:hypothetical protein MACJ_003169 [Theileria orientalis]